MLSGVAAILAAAAAAPAAQVMLETLDMDGDVEEGTGLGATARVLFWAPDEAGIDALAASFRAAAPAEWQTGLPVPGIVSDPVVRAAVAAAFAAAGRTYVAPTMPLPFATDFGNITRVVSGGAHRSWQAGWLGLPYR